MMNFPSRTLILRDAVGVDFGFLRFAPRDEEGKKWDCLFDVEMDPAAETRSEVRWLYKRRYVRCGEHRVKHDAEAGTLTISQGSFTLVLHPVDGDDFETHAPTPPISCAWQS